MKYNLIWIILFITVFSVVIICFKNMPKLNYSSDKLLLCMLNSTNSYIETDINPGRTFINYMLNLDDLFNSKYSNKPIIVLCTDVKCT